MLLCDQSSATTLQINTKFGSKVSNQGKQTFCFFTHCHFCPCYALFARGSAYSKSLLCILDLQQMSPSVPHRFRESSISHLQSGAKHVYGIECSAIADQATRIVTDNGFADRVTIIKGKVSFSAAMHFTMVQAQQS